LVKFKDEVQMPQPPSWQQAYHSYWWPEMVDGGVQLQLVYQRPDWDIDALGKVEFAGVVKSLKTQKQLPPKSNPAPQVLSVA
jgi:hypothetical protein